MVTLVPYSKMYPFIQANLDFKAITNLGIKMNRYSSLNRQILEEFIEEKKMKVKKNGDSLPSLHFISLQK